MYQKNISDSLNPKQLYPLRGFSKNVFTRAREKERARERQRDRERERERYVFFAFFCFFFCVFVRFFDIPLLQRN